MGEIEKEEKKSGQDQEESGSHDSQLNFNTFNTAEIPLN